MHKLLVVEDSKEVYQMVNNALSSFCSIDWASNLEEAKKFLHEVEYELVLLDIELPDGNGVDFCQEISSSKPTLPIFFLSAHSELSDKIMGFAAGADDYITKPFNKLELKARVVSKLKKIALLLNTADLLKWREIEIDKNSQEVFVFDDKSEKHSVDLTTLEFKILIYLSNKPGDVISRDDIMDSIWGKDVFVYSRSVDTHISKLRKKLGMASSIIESIHGVGYKFKPTQVTL